MNNIESPEIVLDKGEDELLLSVSEICELFGKTPMTIYTWRKNENFPIIAISGKSKKAPVRFRLSEVLEWARINGKEVKPEILEELKEMV